MDKDTALDIVLASYRDMFGVKTERGNELHRDACIEVWKLRKRLEQATSFEIMPRFEAGGKTWGEITLHQRAQRDRSIKWVVCCRSFILDKDGDWVLEPLPSYRTEEFIANTRFGFDDAWKMAEEQAEKMRRQAELLTVK